jgi:hypothetical protein
VIVGEEKILRVAQGVAVFDFTMDRQGFVSVPVSGQPDLIDPTNRFFETLQGEDAISIFN